MLQLHINGIWLYLTTERNDDIHLESHGRKVGRGGFILLMILASARVVQLIFNAQLRTQDHKIKEQSPVVWGTLGIVYLGVFIIRHFGSTISQFAMSLFVVDILVFVQ